MSLTCCVSGDLRRLAGITIRVICLRTEDDLAAVQDTNDLIPRRSVGFDLEKLFAGSLVKFPFHFAIQQAYLVAPVSKTFFHYHQPEEYPNVALVPNHKY